MANRVPPPREFSWARTLRTLSFWALLIVGSIFLVQFASTDAWVTTLRQKGVDVRAREEKQSFGVFLFSFLPYLFIIGLLIFMVRQMQQGGNRAFAFGKSKAKLLAGDTPKVTFADV